MKSENNFLRHMCVYVNLCGMQSLRTWRMAEGKPKATENEKRKRFPLFRDAPFRSQERAKRNVQSLGNRLLVTAVYDSITMRRGRDNGRTLAG